MDQDMNHPPNTKNEPEAIDSSKQEKNAMDAKSANLDKKTQSPKKTSKKKKPNDDYAGTKSVKAKQDLEQKSLDRLKKATKELRQRAQKEELERRISQRTKSPKNLLVYGFMIITLCIATIIHFKKKGEALSSVNGINMNDVPRIVIKGDLAELPEGYENNTPFDLTAVKEAYFTNTPESEYLDGAAEALARQKAAVIKYGQPLEIKNELNMHFRLIPPGKFLMGTPYKSRRVNSTEFLHEEIIGQPFYAGAHEITVKQWKSIMTVKKICDSCEIVTTQGIKKCHCSKNRNHEHSELPFNSTTIDNNPVTGASLDDCLKFTRLLNEKRAPNSGYTYYLLSEKEWEYTCRAGCTKKYNFGPAVVAADYACTENSTRSKNVENVGLRLPNAWGLYDMHGNAEEWTRTPYFLYACNELQYAGIGMKKARSLRKEALNQPEHYSDCFVDYERRSTIKSPAQILQVKSWDTPIYDGQVPINIVEPLKNFEVPLRAFGHNFDLYYHDANKNNKYDNRETIWKDNKISGREDFYDKDIDTVIFTFTGALPPANIKGSKNALYYYDKNKSFQWDRNESIWTTNSAKRNERQTYVMRGGAYKNPLNDVGSATRHTMQRQHAPTWAGLRLAIKFHKYLKKIK